MFFSVPEESNWRAFWHHQPNLLMIPLSRYSKLYWQAFGVQVLFLRSVNRDKTVQFLTTYIYYIWLAIQQQETVKRNNFLLYAYCTHLMSDLFLSYDQANNVWSPRRLEDIFKTYLKTSWIDILTFAWLGQSKQIS